ncbi:hypothetical protein NE865_06931 [Phthorimaea operculella]|nr:hypothetical protein NE865_06931 [Phthorimaea operculella]
MDVSEILRTSAEETLKREKIAPRKSWLSTDTIDLMIERRQYRNKTDEESIDRYRKLTNQITTQCRNSRAEETQKMCTEIEDHLKNGKLDKAYGIIRSTFRKKGTKSSVILDENGQMLLNNADIAGRWKRYLEELYDGTGLDTNDIEQEADVASDDNGPEILRVEFDRALKCIQNGKAAGYDLIFIELIKKSNDLMLDEIFDIVKSIYSSGAIPTDFLLTKTIVLPKKANTRKCEEHRTLSLISQASKIILKIIQNRIRTKTESFIGSDQYGFRKHKGTREAILALRQVIDRRLDLSLLTSKKPVKMSPIKINNEPISQVESFKYLGSIITQDSKCTQDIKCRIGMAKQAFHSKKSIFTSSMPMNIRKRFIKTYIWSIALYGCETWTMTQRDRERLEAFEMWGWRRMQKIKWTDKVTNEEVLVQVKEKRNILSIIENRRGKMFGHLMRHDEFIKVIMEGKIEGKRGRGRPRRSYSDQLKEKAGVTTYKDLKEVVHKREDWRSLHRQE